MRTLRRWWRHLQPGAYRRRPAPARTDHFGAAVQAAFRGASHDMAETRRELRAARNALQAR